MKTFKNTYGCLVLTALVCLILSIPVYSGEAVGWGNNDYGQATPSAGNDYTAIAAGYGYSLALKSDGSIVGWGRDDCGQATPPAGSDYIAIATGWGHSLALKSDGSIVGWGNNDYGQATPPAGNDYIAVAAGELHSLALKSDGSIVGWGRNDYGQATPLAGSDYIAVAAGELHSLALKSDGSIVGWGNNDYGQATPPAGNDYTAIATEVYHSLALKSDGSIVGWGNNDYGQATPPDGNDYTAVAAGYGYSLALKSDGSIVGWGRDDCGQATPPAGSDYIAIATGWEHNLALTLKSCAFVLAGDINNDRRVDFYDFALMAENWLIDCIANPSDPACAQYTSGGQEDVRMATYVIAPFDAPANVKSQADYICDGVADNVEIQAAIEEIFLAGIRGVVVLKRGTYYIADTILMRPYVSLVSDDCSHGAMFDIGDINKHAIEIPMPSAGNGAGRARIEGIWIHGRNRWQNNWKTIGLKSSGNKRGCGFFIPSYAMALDGPTGATVKITADTSNIGSLMYLKVNGVNVSGSPFTLSSDIGSLTPLIATINAIPGWTCTNITGKGKIAVHDVVNCTKVPSNCLEVKAETSCASSINLFLGFPYDYFFNRCMALITAQTGFNIQSGHSIHLDRCVSEYVTGDPDNSYKGACGFVIESAYNIDGVRIANCFGYGNNDASYYFDCLDLASMDNRCSGQGEGSYGFHLKYRTILSGCAALNFSETYSAGTQLRDGIGFYVDDSLNIINGCVAAECRNGIKLTSSAGQCVIANNVIRASSAISGTVYGIDINLGYRNNISGNSISMTTTGTTYGIRNYNYGNRFVGNVIYGCDTEWLLPPFGSPYMIAIGNSPKPPFWKSSTAFLDMTNYGSMSGSVIATSLPATNQAFLLPPATFGLEFTFVVEGNGSTSGQALITPQATENIVLDGTSAAEGEYVYSSTVGDMITLKCLKPGFWYNIEMVGTWLEQTPEYTLTIDTVGNGTVAKSPDKPTYHYGDVITLTPTADTGWTFSAFSGDTTTDTITIDGNKTVTATFTQN
jgi:parallel beta-helix repeat protein